MVIINLNIIAAIDDCISGVTPYLSLYQETATEYFEDTLLPDIQILRQCEFILVS